MKLKNLFYLIHRDWIIGHGSIALSDKDKAEQILLQSGGQLAGILQFLRGSASRNFFSSENSWGGQLAGIPEILPGVSLLE
jgi:hypothetical protein